MTPMGFFRHGAFIITAFWLSTPLSARVVDLGVVAPRREQLASQFGARDMEEHEQSPQLNKTANPASSGSSLTMLPGEGRTVYTFAEVKPGIDESLRSPARTLYHEVLGMTGAPKGETWLTLLIVVCLIGVQLRRTQRLLHHRPLAR